MEYKTKILVATGLAIFLVLAGLAAFVWFEKANEGQPVKPASEQEDDYFPFWLFITWIPLIPVLFMNKKQEKQLDPKTKKIVMAGVALTLVILIVTSAAVFFKLF